MDIIYDPILNKLRTSDAVSGEQLSDMQEKLNTLLDDITLLAKQGDNSEATNTAIKAAIDALNAQINEANNQTEVDDDDINDLFGEDTKKTIKVRDFWESPQNKGVLLYGFIIEYGYSEADNIKVVVSGRTIDDLECFYAWKNEDGEETILLYSIEENPAAGTLLYTAEEVQAAMETRDPAAYLQDLQDSATAGSEVVE